ncbi:MAG: ribonuclease H-like domain-containing protein [Nitrosospira sp.]|nr:ribonuclease H-like domain-containing protein [Nitrosospira sp.]
MTLAQRLALLKGDKAARGGEGQKSVPQPQVGSPSNGGAGGAVNAPTGLNGLNAARAPHEPAGPVSPISPIPSMPLNVRLQRLGSLGGSGNSRNPATRAKRMDAEVAARLRGEVAAPGVIQVSQTIPLASRHGKVAFSALAGVSLGVLGLPHQAAEPPLDGLLFLDTETTGLAGGTGTLPFMVCLARIQGDRLQLAQWILTGFAGEGALLEIVSGWIEPASRLVSYNGKSFDVPLLATRYRLARRTDPFTDKGHIDLLHLTRRACGQGWEDCRLQTAEQRLLGFIRENDFPSYLIPQAWGDFVRGGGTESLCAIAEHNRLDVLSLAALLAMLARIYAEPGHEAADAFRIAQVHARRGHPQHAIEHLSSASRRSVLDEAGLLFLARLHRLQRQEEKALAIWHQLRENSCIAGIEALAKYHEHVTRELEAALELADELSRLEPENQLHNKRQGRLRRRLEKLQVKNSPLS